MQRTRRTAAFTAVIPRHRARQRRDRLAGDDNFGLNYAAAGTGSAVTDLIFSIAKRDVTFFSGTAPISFL